MKQKFNIWSKVFYIWDRKIIEWEIISFKQVEVKEYSPKKKKVENIYWIKKINEWIPHYYWECFETIIEKYLFSSKTSLLNNS